MLSVWPDFGWVCVELLYIDCRNVLDLHILFLVLVRLCSVEHYGIFCVCRDFVLKWVFVCLVQKLLRDCLRSFWIQ